LNDNSHVNEIYPPDFFKAFRYSNGSVNPPSFRASYKQTPEDFIVTEELGFDLSGDEQGEQQSNIEGEHFWVFVEKTQRHTTDVAKQLAKQVKIPAKDVGISGMKDHQAVTRQWFSLWKPQAATAAELDFSELDDPTIKILHQAKHIKKLKRGVHKANHFELILRQAKGSSDILAANIERVQRDGVPNYFGEQRFGFKGSNLHKAHEWFTKGYSIKQRNKRSLLLSSARSYLFNQMLSERIKQGDWLTPYIGERLNLDGSKSTYLCEDIVTDQQRIDEGDVHTSSVLWGENDGSSLSDIENTNGY